MSSSSGTKLFVVGVAGGAMVAAVALFVVSPGLDSESVRAAAFFALVGLVAHALAYQLAHGATGSIAHLPFLSAVLVAPGFTSSLSIAACCHGSTTTECIRFCEGIMENTQKLRFQSRS